MSADLVPQAAQTSTDPADTAHLRAGKRITLEEITLHLSGAGVLLAQLARAAETPDQPVELADLIDPLNRCAAELAAFAKMAGHLTAIVAGDVPLALAMPDGARWGAAARGEERRESYGGPAVVPTIRQLEMLADRVAAHDPGAPAWRQSRFGQETETIRFPEAMAGVTFVESKAARARRAAEREQAIRAEVLETVCSSPQCGAEKGDHCRTSTGRISEQPHKGRLDEARATVDARLGYDLNPVAVPGA
ncbi:hypothetical protein [Streptomyces sp. NRRL S-350]|uniref:hypothetical protein n=1 Tax=Streptomyces sp. NRRL S-350 TaxID=1463902 RepID=UPI0004C1C834|nr:hypothetical protein [Streptomyces sp. NRRL S-350]